MRDRLVRVCGHHSIVPRLAMGLAAVALVERTASAQLPGAEAAKQQAAHDEAQAAAAHAEAKRAGALPPPPVPDRDAMLLGDVPNPRSPAIALTLSLAGTAIGIAVPLATLHDGASASLLPATGAFLLLPSAGHAYTLDPSTFVWMGMRALGAGLIVRGALDEDNDGANFFVDAGLALVALGCLGDIVTAPGSANRYNEHHRKVMIAPITVHAGGGVGLVGQW